MPIESIAPLQAQTSVIQASPTPKKNQAVAVEAPATPTPFTDNVLIDHSAKKGIAAKQLVGGTLGGLLIGSTQALTMKGFFNIMGKMAMADGGGPIKGGESGGIVGAVVGSVSGAVAGMYSKSPGQSLVAGAVSGGLASTATMALTGRLNGLDLVLNVSCAMLSGAVAGISSYQIGNTTPQAAQ